MKAHRLRSFEAEVIDNIFNVNLFTELTEKSNVCKRKDRTDILWRTFACFLIQNPRFCIPKEVLLEQPKSVKITDEYIAFGPIIVDGLKIKYIIHNRPRR